FFEVEKLIRNLVLNFQNFLVIEIFLSILQKKLNKNKKFAFSLRDLNLKIF
ncbi:hypothetical protein FWK35_00032530, partial [Aphis craccivora]